MLEKLQELIFTSSFSDVVKNNDWLTSKLKMISSLNGLEDRTNSSLFLQDLDQNYML